MSINISMKRLWLPPLMLVTLILATLLVAGCGTSGKKIDPYEGKSAEEIYEIGDSALKRSNYDTAIAAFKGLDAHYPFGQYTVAGQLNIIYAQYKDSQYPA